MWKDIAWFELRYQARQPLLTLAALGFFALGIALASSDIGTTVGDAPGTTVRNAPIIIVRLMPVISLLGLFVVTAFVGSAALRDFEQRCAMLFFSKPLTARDYLLGRFVGALVLSALVLTAGVAGLVAGRFVPWQLADRVGPFSIAPYAFGWATIVMPNLVMMGALFFALAVWSRRLTVTYVAVVFFIGAQDAIELAAERLSSRLVGSVLEPSGVVALASAARYWTVAEQNTQMPALDGTLLANRLVWLALGAVALAVASWRFSPTERLATGGGRRRRDTATASAPATTSSRPASTIELPRLPRTDQVGHHLRQLVRQARLEVGEIVPRAPFLTLGAVGLLFVLAYGLTVGTHDGMPSIPSTHLMLEAIGLGARLSLVLILALYAGELIFGPRRLKIAQVYDALPVPSWVLMGAKFLALVAITGLYLMAATGVTIAIQLAKGHARLEPWLYLRGLVVIAWPLVLLITIALLLHVVTNRRSIGLLAIVAFVTTRFALPRLGVEDKLLLFGTHPPMAYSEIDGYGHQAGPFLWLMVYWSFGAVVVLGLTRLLWLRGTDLGLGRRWARARRRWRPGVVAVLATGVLGMAASGAWVIDNARVRNDYVDRQSLDDRLAAYERAYRSYADLPLPRVTSVVAEVDLEPSVRRAEIRGRYRLENRGAEAIGVLPITRSPRWVEGVLPVYGGVSFEELEIPGATLDLRDDELGFYLLTLAQPLAAGDAVDLAFTVRVDHAAFNVNRHNHLIVGNGTFFSNRSFFPAIGYSPDHQVWEPEARRKRGLPPIERAAPREDETARQRNYLEADWIQLDLTIATDHDQIAVAPGDLQRTWTEGDRRLARYVSRAPMVDLFPVLSGRFEVLRTRWQEVDIELYVHPGHQRNVERLLDVTRHSLAYMSEHFGPYPHDQLRIVEVPSYHGRVAFSFPQTIAFSESWGFTADLASAELDWLAAVLAHEIAHQWWNHQVVPADVQGATMIAESLSQYAAMMIMASMDGAAVNHGFLAHHLDRYLDGRGQERVREQPLALVENQDYLHYGKGSLAFYALAEAIGPSVLNQALRTFVETFRFQGPPYPTTIDLLDHLRAVTPAREQGLIDDLFETITLFDHQLVTATATPRADGSHAVTLDVRSRKWRDDGAGAVHEVPIDDWVDVVVFGETEVDGRMQETVLTSVRRRLNRPTSQIALVVEGRPVRAAIDPFHKLVEPDGRDNVRAVVTTPTSR